MNTQGVQLLPLDDSTMAEIVANAAKAGVAVVESGGQIAVCGIANIPPGWHRVGSVTKGAAA